MSGFMLNIVCGSASLDERRKYSTWLPGVSCPSGMTWLYSRVRPVERPPSLGDIPLAAFAVHTGGNVPLPQVMFVLLIAPA